MNNLKYIDEINKDSLELSINNNYLLEKKLNCKRIENAYILPAKFVDGIPYGGPLGGIFTQEKEFVQNSLLMIDGGWYEFNEQELVYEDKTVLFVGTFFSGWGHFITDTLKHLWYLQCEEYLNLKHKNIELIFNEIPEFKLHKNHLQLLSLFGINNSDIRIIKTPTKFKEIFFPDSCFTRIKVGEEYFGRKYTLDYLDIINHLTNQVQIKRNYPESIYYSRTGLKDPRDVGEKDIEKLFKKMNFKIIKPENLSFIEQLTILKNCKRFASTEGSISHNAIFLNKGTEVIIIRKYSGINDYQLVVNSAKELNVVYIDSHLTVPKIDGFGGPFFIYVNDNLKKFAKDFGNIEFTYSGFYFSKYTSYLRKLIISTKFNEIIIDSNYENILKKEMSYTSLRFRIYREFSKNFPFLLNIIPAKLIKKFLRT